MSPSTRSPAYNARDFLFLHDQSHCVQSDLDGSFQTPETVHQCSADAQHYLSHLSNSYEPPPTVATYRTLSPPFIHSAFTCSSSSPATVLSLIATVKRRCRGPTCHFSHRRRQRADSTESFPFCTSSFPCYNIFGTHGWKTKAILNYDTHVPIQKPRTLI